VRQLIIIFALLAGLSLITSYTFSGVLLWAWLTIQNPHQEAYGFIQTAPTNLIIAVVTIAAIALSKERKLPPSSAITFLLCTFLVWMTLNSFFAFLPSWSWPYWSRTWKIFAFGLVVATAASTRMRLYALIWVCVISLFYYGVKGGGFTLFTGGHFKVYGPPGTIIGDNNQLAVALLMILPLANFLRLQVSNRFVSIGLLVGIVLSIISILGSYSRGAFIGLGALAFLMLLRSRNRFGYLVVVSLLGCFALYFMPDEFFGRMNTISTANDDTSFTGRLYAWRVAFYYACDHFPFGAGLYGPQLGAIFHTYFPTQPLHAAHSIYFQVLGENGFIGIALYLTLLAAGFVSCRKIISESRRTSDLQWAAELGVAIQSSLFAFAVAGAALSMAYYDLFIIELGALAALQPMVYSATRAFRRTAFGDADTFFNAESAAGLPAEA
jgi:putative inorganic carbon (HCO3(-)) transporter